MDHVVDHHPGPPWGEPSGVQVDVDPAEPGEFGTPHPGGGNQQPQGVQAIVASVGEESPRALLYPPAAEAANEGGADDVRAAVAAWSLVHGLATLWLNQNLPPQLGDDPEQITREAAHYLF
jgi:hypothetical protein